MTDPGAHDPLTVQCIDCLAPIAVPCRTNTPGTTHAARYDTARAAAALPGICGLCGAPMYRFTNPDDAYHLPGIADTCPRLPDPTTDWNTYAAVVADTGVSPGHPGPQHWRPIPAAPRIPQPLDPSLEAQP